MSEIIFFLFEKHMDFDTLEFILAVNFALLSKSSISIPFVLAAFFNMGRASLIFPLAKSHLGDSGRNLFDKNITI